MSTQEGIKTRYISRARYDLFRRMIEQYTHKKLGEDSTFPALYTSHRHNRRGRAYLVRDEQEQIDPVFRKRVVYRPIPAIPEEERGS